MKTNYQYFGEGEKTIVFIHGLGNDLNYWILLSSQLNNEYKILLYDIRGHGKSEFKDFTIDSLVNDLYELLLKENIDKISLVGFSLGGNIALAFTIKYPEIVEKLVLMASFSECDSQLTSRFLEFRNALEVSFEEFYDVIMDYVLPQDILNKNREALELIKYEKAKTDNIEAIMCGVEIGFDFNMTDRLQDISAPTLILSGRDDEIISLEIAEILNRNIKNSRLVVFENTKHNLLIGNNVDEILNLIRQFI